MIDIEVPRQSFSNKEINNIALIDFEHNPADTLLKVAPNKALILPVRITTSKSSHQTIYFRNLIFIISHLKRGMCLNITPHSTINRTSHSDAVPIPLISMRRWANTHHPEQEDP